MLQNQLFLFKLKPEDQETFHGGRQYLDLRRVLVVTVISFVHRFVYSNHLSRIQHSLLNGLNKDFQEH